MNYYYYLLFYLIIHTAELMVQHHCYYMSQMTCPNLRSSRGSELEYDGLTNQNLMGVGNLKVTR